MLPSLHRSRYQPPSPPSVLFSLPPRTLQSLSSLSPSSAHLRLFSAVSTSPPASKSEDEEVFEWKAVVEKKKKEKLKDINRMYGMENAPNSHLRWNSFTTTGNKSEQSFDALTVSEGGRGMEMEKDFF